MGGCVAKSYICRKSHKIRFLSPLYVVSVYRHMGIYRYVKLHRFIAIWEFSDMSKCVQALPDFSAAKFSGSSARFLGRFWRKILSSTWHAKTNKI